MRSERASALGQAGGREGRAAGPGPPWWSRRLPIECGHATVGGHPHVQRVGEHRADAAPHPRVPPRSGDPGGRRRQPRRDGVAGREGRRRAARPAFAPPEREVGTRQRLPRRLRLGPRARIRRVRRDRRGLLSRSGRVARAVGSARAELRRVHRVALRRGGLHPELGLAPPPALAGRQRLRGRRARTRRPRLDRGVPCLQRRHPAPARSRSH